MVFVNDFWSVKGVPGWMQHATWDQDMLGLSDVVFPCFLFVVGMSIPYSMERRFSKGLSGVSTVGHILTRSLALLLMGVLIVNTEAGIAPETGLSPAIYKILMITGFILIWNDYPLSVTSRIKQIFTLLKIVGILLLFYLVIIFRDPEGGVLQSRWWGILGLIGWSYLICSFTYLFTRDRLKYLIPFWLTLVILCITISINREGITLLNLPKDNFLKDFLRILHIGNGALPAFTSGGMILAIIAAKYKHLITIKKIISVLIITTTLFLAGFISHKYWIISKIQETPPFLFYCLAISVGVYFIIYLLAENDKAHWFNIIKIAGTATLTCYLVPYITYSVSSLIGIQLPEWMISGFVGLLKCAAFSFLVIGITYLLGKVRIKLKI